MKNFSLVDTLMGVAFRHPDREAIATPEATYTYAALVVRASQCARYLARNGIRAGDRVAVALSKPDQTIVAMLATWMLGATCMTVDFRMRRAEKAGLAEQFDVAAVLEARSTTESAYVSLTVGDDLAAAVADESTAPVDRPETVGPALIFRSSGTTGTPVGVVYGHSSFMHLRWMLGAYFWPGGKGLFVHALPLYYTIGLMRTTVHLLGGGTTRILPLMTSAGELAEELVSSRAQLCSVVPPQLMGLLDLSAGQTKPLLPAMEALTGAGGTFTAEVNVRAFRELTNAYRVSYGASFAGSLTLLSGEDVLRRPETVGRPPPCLDLRITDPEGAPVGRGEPGLIRVRGASIADGLIGVPRDHSDRVDAGWAVPGDIGFLDEEGFLTLTGRASDMIIRKGVNVYPREVEEVLERRDDVVEAAVVGYPSAESGEEIAAFVVVRGQVSLEDIESHVRVGLVADKRPRVIRIVPQLPRSEAGKVLKRVLRDELATPGSD